MPQADFLIVSQNHPRQLHRARVRGLALALVLPLMGVVTAFGIAPNTVTDSVERHLVTETVALPPVAMIATDAAQPSDQTQTQTFWHEERIQRGDTLARLLSRLQVNDVEAVAFINSAPAARALFQLAPGKSLRAETTVEGKLLALHYLQGEQLLTVARHDEGFAVTDAPAALEKRKISASAVIRSSLFAATDAMNLPDAVATQLVEVFSTEIDFHKDLRKNDSVSVVYEALYDRGEPVGAGRMLSAEFVNQGRKLNVVWFETKPGQGAYFTLDGRDLRKAFLRSPLEFSRVSSGFTEARYHPILNTWTAHKGVDFVAPLGTKIKATADGVVEFAGVQSGYGNVVILRHHNKYTTLYAHMAEFAQGIKEGAKVTQGDVIGNVGMTGLTTGPHVHFEFRIDGVHHDPMSVAMPTAFPIAPELKEKFQSVAVPLARTMTLMRDVTSANAASFE